jgi:predicted DNA-binding transcriptional regulator YafY
VRATVAGLQEVSKWILSWGRDATALAPPDLRKLLHDELAAALATYQQD